MIKVVDNFLPKNEFVKIRDVICAKDFPFFYNGFVTDENSPSNDYYFTHLFYSGLFVDPNCHIFVDILNQLEVKSLIRIKANLYPSTDNIEYQSEHIDYDYEHRGAIFYLNTNNGFTTLENGTKVESMQNRLLLFDPSKPHNSTTCTDDKCRVNVNFNFF